MTSNNFHPDSCLRRTIKQLDTRQFGSGVTPARIVNPMKSFLLLWRLGAGLSFGWVCLIRKGDR
jgi:hypothetical protein